MVKLKKKAEKVRTASSPPSIYLTWRWCVVFQADKDVELQARWKYCALSGEELKQPIVACELGRYIPPIHKLSVSSLYYKAS